MTGATISPCGKYRYRLWRERPPDLFVAPSLDRLGWIMCNPSKADADTDDQTMCQVMTFSWCFGFAELEVVNCYAYRATKPKDLKRRIRDDEDAIGPNNTLAILAMMKQCDHIVCAWGANVSEQRAQDVLQILRRAPSQPTLHCLGTTKSGAPKHPLYLAGDTPLQPFGHEANAQAAALRRQSGQAGE